MSAAAVAPAPRSRSTVKDVQEIFQSMSKERDAPSNVQTTGTLRPVEGGYEQEIVSRSQPRPRYAHGDHVETVTKRTVRTVAGPAEENRDPFTLATSASSPVYPTSAPVGINSTPPDARHVDPLVTESRPGVITGEAYQGSNASWPLASERPKSMYVPLPATTTKTSANDPYFPNQWKRVPSPAATINPRDSSPTPSDASSAATTTTTVLRSAVAKHTRGRNTQPRQLGFGSVDTREVEPSRLSPLRVVQEYAPVKYLSRSELQRLRAERASRETALPRMVRRSSVPRLDELLPHQQDDGFAPRVASRSGSRNNRDFSQPNSRSGSAAQRRVTAEEYAFYNQAPVPSDPFLNNEPYNNTASPPPRAVSAPRSTAYYASPAQRGDDFGSPRSSASSGSAFSPSLSRAGSAGRPVVTASMLPNNTSLKSLVEYVCVARGIRSAPPAPAFGVDAFKLLNFGTYLIKYGRTGYPHERWVTLRLMEDEFGRTQPYLIWALHQDSTSIKDRLNLVHLMDVQTGCNGPNFDRHRLGPQDIRGPHVGDKPSVLKTDFAMTFLFQSTTHHRSVDLLALDDQTFRCWILIMKYIVSVNASANGVQPVDVETLAPESVRSSSAPSRRD